MVDGSVLIEMVSTTTASFASIRVISYSALHNPVLLWLLHRFVALTQDLLVPITY